MLLPPEMEGGDQPARTLPVCLVWGTVALPWVMIRVAVSSHASEKTMSTMEGGNSKTDKISDKNRCVSAFC
jgi:hypothetical protein